MSEKIPTLLSDDEPTRDRLRALLAVLCVVAVVLAGTVVPAVPGGGLGRTPLGSILPQHDANVYGPPAGGGGASAGSGTAGGLGALNPGDRASVGGSLATDDNAFRSQDAAVHFTVESTAPAYWRTGAYDTYTGSGWERSGERRPYDGIVEGDGIRGQMVEYRVTLNRSATALPSVWRPETLSGENGISTDSVLVTDRRAFVTDDPAPAGASYSGVSHLAPRDPDALRTAGRDYPAEIERRYTALPDDTDDLSRFTDELTADADSPYETAARVEEWLESNKNYSLDAPEPDGAVASEFVFEMDAGYCEYFATAMTAMLRTQDVPARYVVGYSTGQQVAPNTYEVRGMNAHAWVEAYFPEVGWVKFDPTPGQDRLQAEQESVANRTGTDPGDYEPDESGSPGEEFSPNGSGEFDAEADSDRPTSAGTGDPARTDDPAGATPGGTADATSPTEGNVTATVDPDAPTTGAGESGVDASPGSDAGATTDVPPATGGTTDPSGVGTTDPSAEGTTDPSADGSSTDGSPEEPSVDSSYAVELNRTPVPGATVAVAVRDDETPASGVPVFFDGERVGTTGEDGTVTARVPYASNLTISVGQSGNEGNEQNENATGIAAPSSSFDAPMGLSVDPLQSAPPGNETGEGQAGENRTGDDRTGENRTGDDRTDSDAIEYELATDANLAVSGDPAVGSEVVVTATISDVPVQDAAVRLDGDRVATTDRRGRAEVRLPDAPGNATVSVERGPVAGETVVSIPRLNVSVDPALPLALPGTPAEINATYGGDPVSDAQVRVAGENLTTDFDGSAAATLPLRGSAEVVVSARGQTRRTTVSGLFANLAGVLGGAALILGGLGYAASRRGYGPRRLASRLRAGVRAVPGLAVALLFAVADRLEGAIDRALAAFRELRAGESTVGELLARLRAWLRERVRAARASATRAVGDVARSRASQPSGSSDSGDPADDSYRTLRAAWADFLGVVSVRDPDSLTPAELATRAIREDDLPAGAVLTLRDAFRDVEYGARSPADRLARVEEAVETIERAARDEGRRSGEDAPGGRIETGDEAPATGDEATAAGDEANTTGDEATAPGGDD